MGVNVPVRLGREKAPPHCALANAQEAAGLLIGSNKETKLPFCNSASARNKDLTVWKLSTDGMKIETAVSQRFALLECACQSLSIDKYDKRVNTLDT